MPCSPARPRLAPGSGLVAVAAWLIGRAAAQPPVLELMVAVVAVRALGISKGMFRYLERLLSHDVAFRALAALRLRVWRRLVDLAPAGLAGWRRGDLLTRLVDDVAAAQDRHVRVLVPALSAMLAGLLAVAVATALLPAAGVVLACGLVVAGLLLPWLGVAATGWTERRLVADRAEVAGRVVESLDGADELTVLGAMPEQRAQVAQVAGRLAAAESRLAWVHGSVTGLGTLTLGATVLLMALVAVPAVGDGGLDGPGLAVLTLLPIAAFDAVGGLTAAVRDRRRVAAALDRVDEVLAAPVPVATASQAPAGDLAGPHIVVRDLHARWPGATADALRNVDLDLPPGKRVAIVGPSGSGKSTLLAALLRFCPYRGDIHLGGVALGEVDEQTLRATIGLAASDAHIFDSTLAANLRLARPAATVEQMRSALDRAGVLDWVESLPKGLDTLVGEHGRSISGGQRQRLAFARALLADVPVLLCDEPDASLEPALAERILADLLRAADGRSIVVVTHRLAGLGSVDEILLMDGGRLRPAPATTQSPEDSSDHSDELAGVLGPDPMTHP